MRMTRAVAFVGFKKSGKTTTIEAVARALKGRGHDVTVAKSMHTHFDRGGSDTWRLSKVADAVIVRAADTDALLFRARDLNALLSKASTDFLLLEGFKSVTHVPKVICAREESDVRELNDGLAIAVSGVISSSGVREVEGLPVVNPMDDPERLADLIESRAFMLPNIDCGMCGFKCADMARMIVGGEKTLKDCVVLSSRPRVIVRIDGHDLPLKDWVQELLEGTIDGMLSAMKGYVKGRRIEIIINRDSS